MAIIITSNALVAARQSKPNVGANFDMREENNIFDGKKRTIYLAPKGTTEYKELPIVESSTVIGFDEGAGIPPHKFSFSCNAEMSDEDKAVFYAECKPVMVANETLESIKEDIVKFYTTDPPKNRQERRKHAKELKKRIARFKAFCKGHNIELNFSR